jgi:broad specificity phosphatase PhoE
MALTLLRHSALQTKYINSRIPMTELPIDPELFNTQKVTLLMQQKFDFVYSSDLVRCQQTLEMLGIKKYSIDHRLQEIRFKDDVEILGYNEHENLDVYKQYFVKEKASWHAYLCDEPPEAFTTRIHTFLEDIPHGKEILVCAHAGTLHKILAILGYAKNKIAHLEYIRIDNVI